MRDYAGWIPSYYTESIRWQPYVGFQAYRSRLQLDDGLWVRVVGALVEAFGAGTVKVLRFEQLSSRLPELLGQLCQTPIGVDQLAEYEERREGLSAKAIEALDKIAALSEPRIASLAVDAVMQRFPRSAEHPAFSPWSEAEARQMRELYERHLEEIGRRHPGVLL
ncbi:hypothetical protein [Falsiroseomonas sp.]|uniref:hypothetical protein n=1 Tax=Falsiroseomonas sp. TaxID=2870721 RepID=UPI00356AC069